MQHAPGVMPADSRPGAAAANVFWAMNEAEAGQFLHGYESVWLPESLLDRSAQARLSDALFETSPCGPLPCI